MKINIWINKQINKQTNKQINKLYKVDSKSAHKLNGTFRLMDDISSINSDGVFEEHLIKIYSSCLELKKENSGNISANVLDLSLSVSNNKFLCQVFDKRDTFKFEVVNFPHILAV